MPEIALGANIAVLGFTSTGEKVDAALRAEYLFVGGKRLACALAILDR